MATTPNSPCRQKGYTPTYRQRNIPGRSDSSVVPAHLLAAVMAPLIRKLEAELDHASHTGAIEVIGHRAAPLLGVGKEAVVRRLYDIRKGFTRSARAEFADAVLLVVDVNITRDTDIPELPVGKAGALDRIEARCELRGITLTKKQKAEMAEDLVEWSKLIIHDGYEALTRRTPAEHFTFLSKHHKHRLAAAVEALHPRTAEVIELPAPAEVEEEELVAA